MEIPHDFRPLDPPARRRAADAARSAASSAQAGSADETTASGEPAVDHGAAAISQLVAAIKTLAPERLHLVETLRERIADGSYSASAEELAGPLADLLGDGG